MAPKHDYMLIETACSVFILKAVRLTLPVMPVFPKNHNFLASVCRFIYIFSPVCVSMSIRGFFLGGGVVSRGGVVLLSIPRRFV